MRATLKLCSGQLIARANKHVAQINWIARKRMSGTNFRTGATKRRPIFISRILTRRDGTRLRCRQVKHARSRKDVLCVTDGACCNHVSCTFGACRMAWDIEKVSGGNGDDAPSRMFLCFSYVDGDSLIDAVGRRDGRSPSFERFFAPARLFPAVVVVTSNFCRHDAPLVVRPLRSAFSVIKRSNVWSHPVTLQFCRTQISPYY